MEFCFLVIPYLSYGQFLSFLHFIPIIRNIPQKNEYFGIIRNIPNNPRIFPRFFDFIFFFRNFYRDLIILEYGFKINIPNNLGTLTAVHKCPIFMNFSSFSMLVTVNTNTSRLLIIELNTKRIICFFVK